MKEESRNRLRLKLGRQVPRPVHCGIGGVPACCHRSSADGMAGELQSVADLKSVDCFIK
jgi:hypothetical protein